jgi:hypothetical protein
MIGSISEKIMSLHWHTVSSDAEKRLTRHQAGFFCLQGRRYIAERRDARERCACRVLAESRVNTGTTLPRTDNHKTDNFLAPGVSLQEQVEYNTSVRNLSPDATLAA